ncbi:hypothetical protein [Halomonas binhaiensis]|uniref:Uncharacterized protein n=1 Tax=Halomonas binhaiensis TaxID=2562282 RepID=A0A5C1NEQ4_9GAMM|nr:hypothetical protein [Halomonas binhaiensis]QEM80189.1 hypothetical protein E4T21_00435 [Halomonas binhaiensis]
MAATVHPLPTSHQSSAVQADRGDWGKLCAELRDRQADKDLAELWHDLSHPERRTLMASANFHHLQRDPRRVIEDMSKADRDAIRASIHRMSRYSSQLRDRLHGEHQHPSRELASHAREALAAGDTEAAMHWLSIIERGIA